MNTVTEKAFPARTAFEWLSRGSVVLGVASALAYGYGWLVTKSYLEAIGAPWYLDTVPFTRIVAEGRQWLQTMIFAAATAFLLMVGGTPQRAMYWISLVSGLVVAVGFVYATSGGLGNSPWGSLWRFFVVFDIGFTLGEWAYGFGRGRYAWGTRNTNLTFMILNP